MNDIRGGHVTSHLDDIQPSQSSEEGRSRDRANLVNALKAASGRSSRASTRFSLERSVHNLAISHFSPTSVQLRSEINGAFPCKRHQKQHLEFCTAYLRTLPTIDEL